jgi:hypothetical protein
MKNLLVMCKRQQPLWRKEPTKLILKLKELTEKLEEFATYNDSLEEVLKTKNKLRFLKFYEKN